MGGLDLIFFFCFKEEDSPLKQQILIPMKKVISMFFNCFFWSNICFNLTCLISNLCVNEGRFYGVLKDLFLCGS